jgi:hypothetical protein
MRVCWYLSGETSHNRLLTRNRFRLARRSGISGMSPATRFFGEPRIGRGNASLIVALVSRSCGNRRALTLKPLLFPSKIGLVGVNPLQQENPGGVGQWIGGHMEIDAAIAEVRCENCHDAIQSQIVSV